MRHKRPFDPRRVPIRRRVHEHVRYCRRAVPVPRAAVPPDEIRERRHEERGDVREIEARVEEQVRLVEDLLASNVVLPVLHRAEEGHAFLKDLGKRPRIGVWEGGREGEEGEGRECR